MKTLAERLVWARNKKDLSQEALADLAGVSQSTIGNLEAGIRHSARKMPQIAFALGVNALWLAAGKGKPFMDGSAPAIVAEAPSMTPPTAKQFGELNWLFMKMQPEYREMLLIAARKVAQQSEDQKLQDVG